MRSWTIIVSAGLHLLAAVVLTHVPIAMGHETVRTEAITMETSVVPLEVAMVDAPRLDVPRPPAEASLPPVMEVPVPSAEPSPTRKSERRPAQRPASQEVASLEPTPSGSAKPGREASRSLSMRGSEPGAPEGPGLDLGLPPVGDAAHALGLQVGAPIVNMLRPDGPPPKPGEGLLGRSIGGGRYERKRPQFTARTDEDGQVHFKDAPGWSGDFYADPKEGVGYRASFDITDQLMRAHGLDPYWAEKLRYLDETREERAGMALSVRRERLRESLRKLPVFLDAVWRDERWSVAERRQVLFQLWDECAEDGPEDIVTVAQQVRLTIEEFVRKRLPQGSADCFVDSELDELNGSRSSKAEFRPYTPAP